LRARLSLVVRERGRTRFRAQQAWRDATTLAMGPQREVSASHPILILGEPSADIPVVLAGSGFRLPSISGEGGRFLRAFLAHPILVTVLRAGLAEAWAGLPFGACGNAGILLFVCQHLAICLRSGRKARSPGRLFGGLGIKRFEPAAPPLVAVPHVPHPVAAAAALDRSIKTFARGPAQGAAAAPAARYYAWRQCFPSSPGPLSC